VYYAPAMDLDMYQHPSTEETFKKLESFGNIQIPAAFGELASGLVGQGRMAEPEEIVSFLENDLLKKLPLRGKHILITAGPTYEAIDPVRFIGNHSSGKMGYAIAEAAASLGAEVVLISGPSALRLENDFVKLIRVTSAEEMYNAAHEYFDTCDVAILSAAVADYRPSEVASEKIKKKTDDLILQLTKTKDILASLGEIKKSQFLVGFALETENEEENAKLKLKKKNLDLIVLNSLRDKGAGFQADTNKITLITKDNKVLPFPVKPKKEVAKDILEYIIEQTNA
jgi:phosphopantothenoylcysteine decarboxylase/phosphopantothenate--cysteine ligase